MALVGHSSSTHTTMKSGVHTATRFAGRAPASSGRRKRKAPISRQIALASTPSRRGRKPFKRPPRETAPSGWNQSRSQSAEMWVRASL